MHDRCVVYGCNNTKDHEHGISIHKIPYFGDVRPEAKKRRKRWTDFVQQKRAKWSDSKFSVIFSEHFVPVDFQRQYSSRGNTHPEAIIILNKITLKPILELYFMKMNYCGAFLKIKVLFRML